jgi:hypothetical protein
MVIVRGGREIVPVDIWNSSYIILTKEAKEKRYTIKDYINQILELVIKKNEFLERYAPYLSVDGFNDNVIRLVDSNPKYKKTFIEVEVKNHQLFCQAHNKTDCVHCHFVWAIPEVANLNLKKPPEPKLGK